MFNAVKVFSASMQRERDLMSDRITEWLQSHPTKTIVDKQVLQSSDSQYHCITVVFFYHE